MKDNITTRIREVLSKYPKPIVLRMSEGAKMVPIIDDTSNNQRVLNRIKELDEQIEANPMKLGDYGGNSVQIHFHNQLLSLYNEKWELEGFNKSKINIWAIKGTL